MLETLGFKACDCLHRHTSFTGLRILVSRLVHHWTSILRRGPVRQLSGKPSDIYRCRHCPPPANPKLISQLDSYDSINISQIYLILFASLQNFCYYNNEKSFLCEPFNDIHWFIESCRERWDATAAQTIQTPTGSRTWTKSVNTATVPYLRSHAIQWVHMHIPAGICDLMYECLSVGS